MIGLARKEADEDCRVKQPNLLGNLQQMKDASEFHKRPTTARAITEPLT